MYASVSAHGQGEMEKKVNNVNNVKNKSLLN